MIYKVKIYEKKKLSKITVTCSEEYIKGLKDDLFDTNTKFLEIEEVIIPKDSIKRITAKKVSDN